MGEPSRKSEVTRALAAAADGDARAAARLLPLLYDELHTLAHMRDIWQPSLIDRTPLAEWVQAGRPSARERARRQAEKILATHQPEPLPCAAALREIVAAYEGKSA